MMSSFPRNLLITATALLILGGISFLWAQTDDSIVNLWTNLANPVQRIKTAVFAIPDGSGWWKSQGQVTVTAEEGIVKVDGSFVTNVGAGNTTSNPDNASMLGGRGNTMTSVSQGVIIGGSGNTMSSLQAFVWGGIGNKVLGNSPRGVVLGGSENQIANGASSTIIWGVNNVVQGGNTTIIGNDNNVAGENSLAMGSKVRIPAIAGDSFARNDGASEFQLQKSHLFAVKAENGVVVGKNVPDANTALTISGDLRIGVDAAKNGLITNTSSNKGVIKSVLTTWGHLAGDTSTRTTQACACFYDGSAWRATSDVPQCIRACGDPQNNLQVSCNTTIFAPTTTLDPSSTWTYKNEFTPAINSWVLWGTTGCIGTGVMSSPAFAYTFTAAGNINTWKWYCVEPESSQPLECNVNYSCQWNSPLNSEVCKYSFDQNETRTDYEGLRKNVNTNLIGTEGRKCNGNLNDTLADKPNPKDQNLNCTNSASPDLDQSLKCQFYCKNGWHREGTICVENSCGSQSTGYLEQQVANAPLLITYVPICLDSGKNTTAETTIDDPRGQGARIKFERTYSCSLGNLTVSTANTKCTFTTQCNPGYHSDITTCQCEPNIYYVQFNGNGGTPSSYKLSQGYVYDTPFSLPNPTPTSFSRVGHTLSWWSTSALTPAVFSTVSTIGGNVLVNWANKVWNFTTVRDATFNLYAVWQKNRYNITFDAWGWKWNTTTASKRWTVVYETTYGDTSLVGNITPTMFQTINQPELTNATFMGWFTAPGTGGTQVTSSMVFNGTSDITLYAHRKLAPVTVEVKLNTGCKKAAGCPTGWAQIATAKDTAGCFLYDYHYRLCARMVLQSPTPSVGATCLAKFQLSTSAVITDSWVDLINGNILFAKTPEVILNFLTFNIFKFSFGWKNFYLHYRTGTLQGDGNCASTSSTNRTINIPRGGAITKPTL